MKLGTAVAAGSIQKSRIMKPALPASARGIDAGLALCHYSLGLRLLALVRRGIY